MNLKFETSILAAIATFSATNDVRYYINGVYVENTYMAATNGKILGWAKHGMEIDKPFIMPFDFVAKLIKFGNKSAYVEIEISGDVLTGRVGDVSITAMVIDGKYPDLKMHMKPSSDHTTSITEVNATYLKSISDAAKVAIRRDINLSTKLNPVGDRLFFDIGGVVNGVVMGLLDR